MVGNSDSDGDDHALAATVDSGKIATDALPRGAALDRYILLSALGSGGMGVVYAAYDPDLDRKLAIKLLRGNDPQKGSSSGRSRLQREAQAMARLQHPNVIAVYDVGLFRDQVFVAMEYVDGVTLRSWMKERPRSVAEVLDVFLPAGRALAAAHAARIIHRDFKPDNVMIGKDERVRVLDFGLARSAVDEQEPIAERASQSGPTPLEIPLTQTGSFLGTPLYMSPEQWLREPAEAASDQFSFCIALWEALYGVRPFAGDTPRALAAAVVRGNLTKPPPDRDVPSWLRDVVTRGLQPDPQNRHASMDALLAALAADPDVQRRKRRRTLATVSALTLLSMLSAFALARLARNQLNQCGGAATRLDGVWDAGRRQALRQAFVATGSVGAANTAERVAENLDAYAKAWSAAHTDACEATHVRGEQSEKLLDLRMACLDRRRTEMNAQIDLFVGAHDPQLVGKAPEAVAKLTALAACADGHALEAVVPPPDDPAVRARGGALRVELARAKALEDAGQYAPARELANTLATKAAALHYPPLTAEALSRRASLEEETGAAKDAERSWRDALPLAAQGRDDALVAHIWPDLIWVVGMDEGMPNDALVLRAAAEAAVLRAGDDPDARAVLANNIGTLYSRDGKYGEAEAQFDKAIASLTPVVGAEHPRIAGFLNNLGIALYHEGKLEEARRTYARALAIWERAYGPDHPRVAIALGNLANVVGDQGKLEEARADLERALAIKERTLSPHHPLIAVTLANLGHLLRLEKKYDEAQREFERSIEISQAAYGREHPAVAAGLVGLGGVLDSRGQYAEAKRLIREALAIQEKTLGPEHGETAKTHFELATVLADERQWKEALEEAQRAIAHETKAGGAESVDLPEPLTLAARAELQLGRADEAVAEAERALVIREKRSQSAAAMAETRFTLAQALWQVRRDPARALALAGAARAGFDAPDERARVEDWLSKHR